MLLITVARKERFNQIRVICDFLAVIEADFRVFRHFQFHPGLFVQNVPFAARPGGQGHVKKNETSIYIFRSAPEIRTLREIGTRKG